MDVFQYLDPYAFMQNYYQLRKAHEDDFSYTTWADELGMKSSSTLRMMVNRKKKLSQGVAEKFVMKSLSSPEEKNYFRLLVSYVHAPTNEERNALWKSLSLILADKTEQKEVKNFLVYLSDLIIPKLLTILSFIDEKWTVEKLARTLDAKVEMVQAALDQLETSGMVSSVSAESGFRHWQATERLLKVGDKLGDAALTAYHNASLDEAKSAQNLPPELRRYRSLLLPLSLEELQSLKLEVEAFTKQLISRYQSDHYKERRLYKLNLNFFPVTQELGGEASPIPHSST